MSLLLPDGSPWQGSTTPPTEGKAEVTQKAATGPGVGFFSTAYPLSSHDRTPQAIMRRAQLAYHTNTWVGLAESTVTRKVVGLPWHFEDGNDEEYTDGSGDRGVPMPEDVRSARLLLERPQFNLPPGVGRPGAASRRLMMGLTSRHVGLCGMSYWYGDQMDARGIPLAWLYINPARMWPAEDPAGNVTGWVLDPIDDSGRGGTPLELSEVLAFYLDPPDWGNLGTGIYERAILKASLSNLADQHTAYVLGTGGRIAGIVSPKEGIIPDEKFKTLVREFRNVNEAPDAAKRTTILDGPIDFTPTAADPSELELVNLAKMNRDDILANWGVPPSQAGIVPQHGGGLNSGATKGYDEAVLMQGAVHDRVLAIKETLQFGWLDKYKPLIIELEIKEPQFDDESPVYALLAQAAGTALTNAERREIIGLPPTGDPTIDNAILLPTLTTLWATAPGEGTSDAEAGIEVKPPAPVLPPGFGVPSPVAPAPAGKASGQQREFLGLRKSVDTRVVPAVRKDVAAVIAAQQTHVVAWVRSHAEHLKRKPTDRAWWNETQQDAALASALDPHLAGIAETVNGRVRTVLEGKAAPVATREESIDATLRRKAHKRIVDINQVTRDAVADAIEEGIADGLGAAELGDLIEGLGVFGEARAETIARTETMFAYNTAAIDSYRDFGVERVIAYDGDNDEVCAERDGKDFSLEDAQDIQDHPNGTLDWAPYFGKATAVRVTSDLTKSPYVLDPIALLAALPKAEPVVVNVKPQDPGPPMRTVIDRDPYTNRVTGYHEEPYLGS